eukprot:2210817-Ditylum_brightwellii.AAC.1
MRDHLILCKLTVSQKWHETIFKDIPKTLWWSHTKLKIQDILIQMIRKLYGEDYERVDNNTWHRQQQIRLQDIFNGNFSQEWAQEQDDCLWDKKLWTPCTNGHQWVAQTIKFLWDQFLELWNKQNVVVYGINHQIKTDTMKDRLYCTIETMYNLKDQLLV